MGSCVIDVLESTNQFQWNNHKGYFTVLSVFPWTILYQRKVLSRVLNERSEENVAIIWFSFVSHWNSPYFLSFVHFFQQILLLFFLVMEMVCFFFLTALFVGCRLPFSFFCRVVREMYIVFFSCFSLSIISWLYPFIFSCGPRYVVFTCQ